MEHGNATIFQQHILLCISRNFSGWIYVDDILIFSKNKSACDAIYLSKQFRIEYLRPPRTFLSLNIVRTTSTIPINQTGYIDRMLARFKMSNCASASTSLNTSLPLQKAQELNKRTNKIKSSSVPSIISLFNPGLARASSVGGGPAWPNPRDRHSDETEKNKSGPDRPKGLRSWEFLGLCQPWFTLNQTSHLRYSNWRDSTATHLRAAQHVLQYLQATKEFFIIYRNARDLTTVR